MITAIPTASTSAAPVDRTRPAAAQQTPARIQRFSSSPTSDHAASAQNSAPEYAIDSTIDIGVAANSATRISPVRREPPRMRSPSRSSAYEHATPEMIVTVNDAVTRTIPLSPSRQENQRKRGGTPGQKA